VLAALRVVIKETSVGMHGNKLLLTERDDSSLKELIHDGSTANWLLEMSRFNKLGSAVISTGRKVIWLPPIFSVDIAVMKEISLGMEESWLDPMFRIATFAMLGKNPVGRVVIWFALRLSWVRWSPVDSEKEGTDESRLEARSRFLRLGRVNTGKNVNELVLSTRETSPVRELISRGIEGMLLLLRDR